MIDALIDIWNRLPVKVSKALTDFWTTLLAGFAGMTIILPSDGEWKPWALATGAALLAVVVNALRRAVWNTITEEV